MQSGTSSEFSYDDRVPSGYSLVPLDEVQKALSFQFCIIVRDTPDSLAGRFVLLKTDEEYDIYLTCLADSNMRVVDWLELWVQKVPSVNSPHASLYSHYSNLIWDLRWESLCRAFVETFPESTILTSYSVKPSEPLLVDCSLQIASVPTEIDPTGEEFKWSLCNNDDVLQAASLPAYSSSQHRYLYQEDRLEGFKFVPVTEGAPETPDTYEWGQVFDVSASCDVFNLQCGKWLIRRHTPIRGEAFVDLLGGKSWEGVDNAMQPFDLNAPYKWLAEISFENRSTASFLFGNKGIAGRLVEAYYLKLQFISDLIRSVRDMTEKTQLPYLNLSPSDFSVAVSSTSTQLPLLWTFRTNLGRPTHSYQVDVESEEARFFGVRGNRSFSIYKPDEFSEGAKAVGSLRIRSIESVSESDDRIVIEGTLSCQEKLDIASNELLIIHIVLQDSRLKIAARISGKENLASGELRFRSFAQSLEGAARGLLDEAQGVPLQRIQFELLPIVSSPADLYSLAVIAVQTLLVNKTNALPTALDELLSFARELKEVSQENMPMNERIAVVVSADLRWRSSLGPHRLRQEELTPDRAFECVPADLWWNLIGELTRFFPNVGPNSFCSHFGDASTFALEAVFDEPLECLHGHIVKARSLLLMDWDQNAEMKSVIDEVINA